MPARLPDSVLEPYTSMLGKIPDHKIAQQAGVSRAIVIAFRKRLGIPAYDGYKFGSPGNPAPARPASAPNGESRPFRGRRSALDPFAHLLGTVPDHEIARSAGVTPENVRTYRQRRGIHATWAHERTSTNGAAEMAAWVVTVEVGSESHRYAILAPDIGTAAGTAIRKATGRHPGAVVKGLQRIADVLP